VSDHIEQQRQFVDHRETLHVEGESRFIAPHPEQFDRLLEARSRRETENCA
jgi:hypothetical protein